MSLTPLNDRVVVEPIANDNQTPSGLHLPENAAEKPQTGKVIAHGPGKYQNGEFIKSIIENGQIVLFAKYAGTEIKYQEKKYLILQESDILCIITN